MLYNYLNNISQELRFKYLMFILIGTFLLKRIVDSKTILIIGIILVFIYLYNEQLNQEGGNFIENCTYIINLPEFKRFKYLYLNSEILYFLNSIRRFRYYSPAIFHRLIADINSFLKLSMDMENDISNISETYEVLNEYKFKVLNDYMSFIYKLPIAEPELDRYHLSKDKLEDLLNQVLDTCYQFMVYKLGKTPIDNSYKFIYKNQPRFYDNSFEKHYEIYN